MEEFNKLINGSKPVLVDFLPLGVVRAECKALFWTKSNQLSVTKLMCLKLMLTRIKPLLPNIPSNPSPLSLYSKNGEPVWRASGLHHADDLVSKLRENL